MPTLTDGVVALRPPERGDVDAITVGCQDPSVSRYTSIPSPYERAHAEAFVRDSVRHWRDGVAANFVVTDADTGVLLGGCGVIRLDEAGGATEIGYWLTVEARGRGVMTRTVELVADWVLHDLGRARLELQADVRNTASQRVAERAGFVREGEVPPPARLGERSETMVLFARTADRV